MTKEELIQIRESLNLTKSELAEKLGVKPMLLGRYESGGCKIPEQIIEKIQALMSSPTEDNIPELICGVRSSLSLSKASFAKMIGVSGTAVGNYESGKNRPKDEVLKKIKELVATSAEVKKEEEAVEAVMPAPVAEEKPTRKKQAGTTIIIQSKMGGSITPEEILSRVPADAETIYIKPEENAAYWVKGDESGSVTLW